MLDAEAENAVRMASRREAVLGETVAGTAGVPR
jgi:hypothetical protein